MKRGFAIFTVILSAPDRRQAMGNTDPHRTKAKSVAAVRSPATTITLRGEGRMNRSLVAAMATAALTLGVPGIAGAKDKDTCGPHTLKGEYLLSASGFTRMSPDPTWVPKAILELIQFNGDGITVATPAITIANPLNNTGAVLERIPGSTGTYTLDPETCLGMITFPDGPQWRLYVSPAGDEFWMIQTAGLQGTQNVLEGRAKRIR